MPRINIPPVTRAFLTGVCSLSLLYGVARWQQYGPVQGSAPIAYLSLVPARFLLYPWTLLCATFVERNIFTVITTGATIFYGGKYLERAWGSMEFGKFLLVIALLSNTITTLLYIIVAAIVGNSAIAEKGICGGVAIQAGFLVAFKQLVPEHTVTLLQGVVKMRVKHFPAIFLALNAIGAMVLGMDTTFNLSWLGFLIGWSYLRFYKRQPDLSGTSTQSLGIKGDASETFAFACFFPDVIQPPITFISDRIYSILVALRVCTPFSAEDIASGNQQAIARGEAGLPSLLNPTGRADVRSMGKREEAERRRALALKALDQRLQAASANRAQPATNAAASCQPPPQSTPQSMAPAVAPGQSMLGETSYTPDRA
ncbi:hypothetical protein D8B26_001522 [Coccidioides posadasii str. Silveira]|uniref:Rhomboid family protein n=2 Tax=Coccidioides posadasii TaxID=199306 RepID=E9CVI1_COCPS|nr:hypothetical protein CPC735_047870 [Coccidioides posadasii C735 delta SOWgp]EER23417.1 hypothetical protein CPC735_047870 [Coccidioides posadasii C735 delta SOWgp]EFW21307.1 rhomboid family protein [Coccidioides posadasii str. Silveira]QVM06818.1 hypothetical protein D8B26_001522 [Coccidioides posadasii str. Silveira]|eukprot:XP_003065562.1 hypothetical protein CPC735_047870 [Coccidioides posadasii C735 delta SOWgp]